MKNGVKNIQTAGYNGAFTVSKLEHTLVAFMIAQGILGKYSSIVLAIIPASSSVVQFSCPNTVRAPL